MSMSSQEGKYWGKYRGTVINNIDPRGVGLSDRNPKAFTHDLMVSDFPAPGSMPVLPADYLGRYHHGQRATIAAYVRAAGRDAWLAPPTDPARRSGLAHRNHHRTRRTFG